MQLASLFSRARQRTPSTTNNLRYLGDKYDLDDLKPGEIGVVAGDLIIMGLNEKLTTPDFIGQPARSSRRTDYSIQAIRTKPTTIHYAIRPSLLDATRASANKRPRARIIYAADAIIAYGSRFPKETLLVVNGYISQREETIYFDTYIFHHGQVIEIKEALIPLPDNPRFQVDVKQHLASILKRHPGATIHWTPPIKAPYIDGMPIIAVPDSIYTGKKEGILRLFANQELPSPYDPKAPAIPTYRTPAAIVAGTVAIVTATLLADANALNNSKAEYQRLTRDSDKQKLAIPLDIQQNRADWHQALTTGRRDHTPATNQLLNAIATHPEWRVTKIELDTANIDNDKSKQPGGAQPDAYPINITINIPINTATPAIEQAQPVVADLKRLTDLKRIEVAQQGIRPDAVNKTLLIDIGAEEK